MRPANGCPLDIVVTFPPPEPYDVADDFPEGMLETGTEEVRPLEDDDELPEDPEPPLPEEPPPLPPPPLRRVRRDIKGEDEERDDEELGENEEKNGMYIVK